MPKKIIFSFLILLIAWFMGLLAFAYTINHYTPDTTTHTDAIIVLTGGRNRITEAVKLLNQKMADILFISGVNRRTSLKNIQNSQNIDISNRHNIDIGYMAVDTQSNAEEALLWIKSKNISSFRLVTSNYHLPRSMLEFRHIMPEVKIIPHPVYSERIEKKWWTSWRTCSLICKEYNKFIYRYIQYLFKL